MPTARGVPKSPEHRAKIAAANRGRHGYLAVVNRQTWDAMTPEQRAARLAPARAAITEEVRGRQGQTLHTSTRGQAALAAMHDARRAEPPQSPERRARMSASCKASPRVQANVRKAAAAAARAKPSSIERIVRGVLDALGVEYVPAYPIGRFVADIYVPTKRLVIECDGEYWHRYSAERDRQRDLFMANLGYTVVRLGEREIRAGLAPDRLREVV